MAKVDENIFKSATNAAGLTSNNNKQSGDVFRFTVYDVPIEWRNLVKSRTGIKSMAAYARQAILEKLERDGLM